MPAGRFSANAMRRTLALSSSYWGVYAALDYCLSDTLSAVLQPSQYVPDPSYWNAGLLALLIITGAGTPLGAVAGLLCGRDGAALSVIAVFAVVVGASSSPGLTPLFVTLAVPLALGAVVLWSNVYQARAQRFWFLTNPWTVSLVLIVRPWLYRDILGDASLRWQLIVASALALVAIAGFSWLFRRRFSIQWIRYAAVLLGLVSIAAGFGMRGRSGFPATADSSQAAGKPNIILITLDTVRADHLSVYGYERDTTPNLRRFAAESTLYRHAISAANWTAPSHASIFTGMYTLRHGVRYDVPDNRLGTLPDAVPTLAEALAHQGYRTAGLVANYEYLSDSLGFGRGFDVYRLAMPWMVFEQSLYPSALRWMRRRLLPRIEEDIVYLNSERMTAEALRILDRLSSRQPFFLFLNYMDAHWPYAPPEPFLSRFAKPSRQRSNQEYYDLARAVDGGERVVTEAERRDLVGAYDGGIAYMDDRLGILFDALRRAGVYDRALIIVTSDHGEAFGEKSLLEHGKSLYQDEVHVPLLIKYPGQREPAEVSAMVSGVDLFPTVTEAVGAQAGPYLAGLPLQRGSGPSARPVFAESYLGPGMDAPRVRRTQRAIFRDSWKVTLSTEGGPELYNLAADAGENSNVIREQPGVAAQMEAALSAWQGNLAPVGASSGLDKATLERLKSLGYVQ